KDIITNLLVELKRGTQTLAVLSLFNDKQYGYSLLQALEEKDIPIEAGTLYPMLRRLETQGILTSEWDTEESRPRKFYQLSSFGHQAYNNLKEAYFKMHKDLVALIQEENHE
ncbi:MAG: PadR family transcriptional regulator, partial [Acholeplasmataceae bacterium]|nr:PadR family transcriptional regulator [Acholeplasmataceae bacterium]